MAEAIIENYTALMRALAKADKETRNQVRAAFREVAEPTAREIESLAPTSMRGMSRSPKWAKMRIGVTKNLVYIVPRQKGYHGRNPSRRQAETFANRLWLNAMYPAAKHGQHDLEANLDHAFGKIATEFNRGM